MFRTSRERLARETWEWLYLTEVLTVLTDRSRGDIMGGRGSLKKCQQALSPIFPAATAPFPKSRPSYFRFAPFNTCPLYYLRAWHRLAQYRLFRHCSYHTCQSAIPLNVCLLLPWQIWSGKLSITSMRQWKVLDGKSGMLWRQRWLIGWKKGPMNCWAKWKTKKVSNRGNLFSNCAQKNKTKQNKTWYTT